MCVHRFMAHAFVTWSDLGSGLPCSLCFSRHGSLQLMWQLHIFNLHTLHLDAPVVCGFIEAALEKDRKRKNLHPYRPQRKLTHKAVH